MAGLDDVDQRGWPLPSRRVTARLRGDERLVAATRQHWVRPAGALAGPTALAALLIWLAGVLPPGTSGVLDLGWVVWLGLVVRMGWQLWGWSVSWFAVTDERLLLSYGRLTHKLAMMPLSKVTDMTYVRTSLGQALGYGEFVLESAGQDQALHRVRLLPRSQRLYDQIYEQLARRDRARYGARGGGGGGARGSARPAAAAAEQEGVEAVRVSRSAGSTRSGRWPGPVRVRPGDPGRGDPGPDDAARQGTGGRDATQVVDAGPARRETSRRTGGGRGDSSGSRPGAGGARGSERQPEDGRGGRSAPQGVARRVWRAVRGGPTPSVPAGPGGPSGGPSGKTGTVRRRGPGGRGDRGWAARAWSAVRGGDGSRL